MTDEVNYVSEERVIFGTAIDEMRKELELSIYSRTSSDFEKVEKNAQGLLEQIQCGICYSVVTPDMNAKQCPKCESTIYCNTCANKVNRKCSFCNTSDIIFRPVNVHF